MRTVAAFLPLVVLLALGCGNKSDTSQATGVPAARTDGLYAAKVNGTEASLVLKDGAFEYIEGPPTFAVKKMSGKYTDQVTELAMTVATAVPATEIGKTLVASYDEADKIVTLGGVQFNLVDPSSSAAQQIASQ